MMLRCAKLPFHRLLPLAAALALPGSVHAIVVAGDWTFADMEQPYAGPSEAHDSIASWVGSTGSLSQATLTRPRESGRFARLEYFLRGSDYPGAGVSFRSTSGLPADVRHASAISLRIRGSIPTGVSSVRVSLYSPQTSYLSMYNHGGNLGAQLETQVRPDGWTQVVVPLSKLVSPDWDRADVFALEALRDSVLSSVVMVAFWVNGADSLEGARGFLDIDQIQFLSLPAPPAPWPATLIEPRDGAIKGTWTPLRWTAPLQAGRTRLQLSADPSFSKPLLDTTWPVWGGGPYQIRSAPPPSAGIYHWRVSTTSEGGTTWSEERTIDWRTDPADTLWKRQSIAFPPQAIHALGEPPFDPGAVASSGLPVLYASSDTGVARIERGLVSIVGTGRAILTASQPGDADHSPASDVVRILDVSPTGSGSGSDPYLIRSIGDLAWVSGHPETWMANFRQTADIDARLSGTTGFRIRPIGDRTTPFGGTYDGGGRLVSNLKVVGADGPTGLFGVVEHASLRGIHLVGDSIQGGDTTGALVGIARASTVSDCSSAGWVNGAGDVGGLAGVADRTEILSCRSRGVVVAIRGCAGGLVSRSISGSISRSTSSVDVSNSAPRSGGEATGGLAGFASGAVSNSYSTGRVRATGNWAGGLVGNSTSTGSIRDCYATGPVEGSDLVGGIAGSAANVRNTYATGEVVARTGSQVGGLVGFLPLDHGLENSVWDTASTGQRNPLGSTSVSTGLGVVGKSREAMSSRDLYLGWGWAGSGWLLPTRGLPVLEQVLGGYLPDSLEMTVGDPDFVADTTWNRGSIFLSTTDPKIATVGRATIHPVSPGRVKIGILHELADGQVPSDSCWLEVRGKPQSIEFPPLAVRIRNDPDFLLEATASSGGSVEFTSSAPQVATVDRGRIHLVGPGIATIRASQAGGNGFASTYVERTLRVVPFAAPSGSGTPADPFRISSYDDLRWLAIDSIAWRFHFAQTADIDARTSRSSGAGLPGIGTDAAPFEGSYQGQGHAIRHIFIQSQIPSNRDPQGLFSVIGASGEVRRVVLEDADVFGSRFGAGSLAGSNRGSIDSCATDAHVASGKLAGGLAGENLGTIRRSAATGVVELQAGSGLGGGLVGSNQGTIEDCYSTSTLRSQGWVSGIAGSNSGRIRRCYSLSGDSPTSDGVAPGNVDSSFWNKDYLETLDVQPPFLPVSNMTDSVHMSRLVGNSGNWTTHWGTAPPSLSGVENPPWARTDTLTISDTFDLARLLENDGFAPDERARLVLHLDSLLYAKVTDSTSRIVLPPVDTTLNPLAWKGPFYVYYRVGRIRQGGDTLWGNRVWSLLRRSRPPVLSAPTFRIREDSSLGASIARDPDGDPLDVSIRSKPILGTAMFHRDTLRYIPYPDAHGSDSMEVSVSDGTNSVSGWLRVSILSVNDPPLAPDRTDSVKAGGRDSFALSATDKDGVVSAFQVVDQPHHGTVRLSKQFLTYAPDPGFSGRDTLRWVAVDDSGASSRAALWVFEVFGATSGLSRRAVASATDGRIRVLHGLDRPAPTFQPARLDDRSSVCDRDASCASIRIPLSRPSRVRIAIHDHLGVGVLSGERSVSGGELASLEPAKDGKRLLDVGWNLRASTGAPVASGVYVWTVEVVPDQGDPWTEHVRTGVVAPP